MKNNEIEILSEKYGERSGRKKTRNILPEVKIKTQKLCMRKSNVLIPNWMSYGPVESQYTHSSHQQFTNH